MGESAASASLSRLMPDVAISETCRTTHDIVSAVNVEATNRLFDNSDPETSSALQQGYHFAPVLNQGLLSQSDQ